MPQKRKLCMSRADDIKKQMAERNAMRPPSKLENQFSRILRLSGLKFVTELQLGFYFIDFALPDYKIALEVDGREYHSKPEQTEHDAKKDEYLRSIGWSVIRIPSYAVFKSDEAYEIVKKLCWRLEGYEPPSMIRPNEEFDPILHKVCSGCGDYHAGKNQCIYDEQVD